MKFKIRLLMALRTWVVIYPSITLFLFLFGQRLSALPLYQRTFVLTISLVPWMIFLGLPLMEMIARLSKKRYYEMTKVFRPFIKRPNNKK